MVCLDANVLLEIVLDRQGKDRAEQAIAAIKNRPGLSMLSLHLLVYFAQREGVSQAVITKVLERLEILDLTKADYEWARLNMRDDDFEDALQLAVAIRNGCREFITFDKALYKRYRSLPQLKLRLL